MSNLAAIHGLARAKPRPTVWLEPNHDPRFGSSQTATISADTGFIELAATYYVKAGLLVTKLLAGLLVTALT